MIPLSEVLNLFRDWDEMLRLEIGSKKQTAGKAQNYWIMLMKKENPDPQQDLTGFSKSKRID